MNLFISQAYAAGSAPADMPGGGEAFMLNILFILILVVLFYVLLIMPQQKRFKKHQEMLGQLKKGDRVITAGGLIGKVAKIDAEKKEVTIDLGNDIKVTALRSTIQSQMESKQEKK